MLACLAALGALLGVLPGLLAPDGPDRPWLARDVVPWVVVLVLWELVVIRAERGVDSLSRLPMSLFRTTIAWGVAAALVTHLAGVALPAVGHRPVVVLVLLTVEDLLYTLGMLSLGALAAYALSRTLLRRALGRVGPAASADLSLRTRFVVMTAGVSFATAGILLDVLVDFERTPDGVLLAYLLVGAALVAFATVIGWLVGDDFALREHAAAAAIAERERIARELHDGVAKSVSILALEAATAASRLPEDMRPELLRIQRLARLLSEEMRAILSDVRTQGDAHPFSDALRGLVDRHAPAELVVEGELDRVGTLARFEVLRIVDEALTNATRHAHARRMRARIAARGDRVTVEVEDDGMGIADVDLTTLPRSGRYGLMGIRERAELLRGSAVLERSALGGTMLRVDFPLAPS